MIDILQEIQYYVLRLIFGSYRYISGLFVLSFIPIIAVGIYNAIKEKRNPFPTFYYDVCKRMFGGFRFIVRKILWVLLIINLILITNQDFLKNYNMGQIDRDGNYESFLHYPIVWLVICFVLIIIALVSYYCGYRRDKKSQIEKKRQAFIVIRNKIEVLRSTDNMLIGLNNRVNKKESNKDIIVCACRFVNENDEKIVYDYLDEEEVTVEEIDNRDNEYEYEMIEVNTLLKELEEQRQNTIKTIKEKEEIIGKYFLHEKYLL